MLGSDQIGLVWFRRDLRLRDNPAWAAATTEREAVIPLYVLDPRLLATAGPYRRRYLVASLQALDYDLFEKVGGRLLVRVGDPTVLVPEALEVLQAGAVYWNGDTTPFSVRRDGRVRAAVEVPVHESWGTMVHAPGSVVDDAGRVPTVFADYDARWRAAERLPWPEPGEALVYDDPGEPLPRLDGRPPLPEGEGEAAARLDAFVAAVDGSADHDRLDLDLTSHLSADLRFGILSPRIVLDRVGDATPERSAFVTRLCRRDWLAHLLGEHPDLPSAPLDPGRRDLPWRDDRLATSAWKGGFTGYPAVDAAMRQLRDTRWLPDRARHLAASFLVEDLRIDWKVGEQHFRHLLVDADVAQNVGNWQAVAKLLPAAASDAAAPDPAAGPVETGRRWDPDGDYVRRWVPELAAIDDARIHAPWSVPADELAAMGITLGSDYPDRVGFVGDGDAPSVEPVEPEPVGAPGDLAPTDPEPREG